MNTPTETIRKSLLGTCRIFKSKIGTDEEREVAQEFEQVIREFTPRSDKSNGRNQKPEHRKARK